MGRSLNQDRSTSKKKYSFVHINPTGILASKQEGKMFWIGQTISKMLMATVLFLFTGGLFTGSSVSVMSGYGLDDRAIEVLSM
jgi:hypothetical protein